MVDVEERKISEVAAEFGCKPAVMYSLLVKLRRAAIKDGPPAKTDEDDGPAKPGEQTRSVVDGALGRRELGLPAPIPLSEGLTRTAAWFRERAK